MEEGTRSKKTVFIGGISEDTDETTLYENFSTFGVFVFLSFHLSTAACLVLVLTQVSRIGDIIEVQLPPPVLTHHQQTHPTGNGALLFVFVPQNINLNDICAEPKHRGFAFVTFGSSADAQDAIDNMDMNELKGRVLKVNLARPMKGALQPNGNRASKLFFVFIFCVVFRC